MQIVLILHAGASLVGTRTLFWLDKRILDAVLQGADTCSDSFAELGKLLGAEHEQSDSKNHQQMQGL